MTRKTPKTRSARSAADEQDQLAAPPGVGVVPVQAAGGVLDDDAAALAGDELVGLVVHAAAPSTDEPELEPAEPRHAAGGDPKPETAAATADPVVAVLVDTPAAAPERAAAGSDAPESRASRLAAARAAGRAAAVNAGQFARSAAARQATASAHSTAELARQAARAARTRKEQTVQAVRNQARPVLDTARGSGRHLLVAAAHVPAVQKVSRRARQAAELERVQAARARRRRLMVIAVLGAAVGVAAGLYLKRRSTRGTTADHTPDPPAGAGDLPGGQPDPLAPVQAPPPAGAPLTPPAADDGAGSTGADDPRC